MGNYELLVRGIMDLPNKPAIINLQYVLILTDGLSLPSSFLLLPGTFSLLPLIDTLPPKPSVAPTSSPLLLT